MEPGLSLHLAGRMNGEDSYGKSHAVALRVAPFLSNASSGIPTTDGAAPANRSQLPFGQEASNSLSPKWKLLWENTLSPRFLHTPRSSDRS